jgi:hypothetical protein
MNDSKQQEGQEPEITAFDMVYNHKLGIIKSCNADPLSCGNIENGLCLAVAQLIIYKTKASCPNLKESKG